MKENLVLTKGQLHAFEHIKMFLQAPGSGIFILKGYAGTGKTTLLQYLALQLRKQKKKFTLLAPTGRAAAVLRAKTGLTAKTIHSELYIFNDVDGEPDEGPEMPTIDSFGQMRLMFALKGSPDAEDSDMIYIVDEASMVSDEPADVTSYAHFGSGHLLSDLLYAAGKNKIIFAGDPCQLPPVLSLQSPALSSHYFRQRARPVQEYELTQILRHKEGSGILQLATRIRQLASARSHDKWVKLPVSGIGSVSALGHHTLQEHYLQHLNTAGIGDIIAISNSNRECSRINRLARIKLYGSENVPLQVNDLLMVTQNNYLVPLTNGDFVTVKYIGNYTVHLGIGFIEVTVKANHSGEEYQVLLCEAPLFNGMPNLTQDQQRMLMIDFSKRMRKKGIKPKSDQYYEAMRKDKYLNSLRANFGYAVTCHKSQGGEWEKVYLFLNKSMYIMPPPTLTRWWYTAVTRAKESLWMTHDWWIG